MRRALIVAVMVLWLPRSLQGQAITPEPFTGDARDAFSRLADAAAAGSLSGPTERLVLPLRALKLPKIETFGDGPKDDGWGGVWAGHNTTGYVAITIRNGLTLGGLSLFNSKNLDEADILFQPQEEAPIQTVIVSHLLATAYSVKISGADLITISFGWDTALVDGCRFNRTMEIRITNNALVAHRISSRCAHK